VKETALRNMVSRHDFASRQSILAQVYVGRKPLHWRSGEIGLNEVDQIDMQCFNSLKANI
jgi:hypothetical protein